LINSENSSPAAIIDGHRIVQAERFVIIFPRRLDCRVAMADAFPESGGQVRPTRHRLAVTMAASACVIAALLALLGSMVDFIQGVPGQDVNADRLTVFVRPSDAGPSAEVAATERTISPVVERELPVPADPPRQTDAAIETRPDPPADRRLLRDWHAMAEDAARSSVADLFRDRGSRMDRWRQSHAIMFRPTDDFTVAKEEPIIPGFRFKPEIHVVGLGFTIGSCFIGIPLAGVPVEQRSVAMTLIVCAGDAG
jgi:hypothetical protein